MPARSSSEELRVLILAPAGADARVIARLLTEAGLESEVCADARRLSRELEAGAGAAVVAEEALGTAAVAQVAEVLAAQPEWSDLPLILLALPDHETGWLVEDLWRRAKSHVAVLERPIRGPALLSTVRMALQSRRRQFEVRDELARRLEAERALAEADRRKDAFLAVIGHELRNPLAAMVNSLELLRRRLGDAAATPGVELLGRQLGRLTRLVDDLLDVSRITHGKLELRCEPVALAELVERAVEAVQTQLEEAGHRLHVALPEKPAILDADPLRLEQVLVNLLGNAVKYTPRGGRIELSAEVGESGVRLSVRDDGLGMPPEKIDSLFAMFEQLDARPQAGGLGIGLALSRQLVEMHGGRLEARSEGLGRGSEFTVLLPAEIPVESAASPGKADEASGEKAAAHDLDAPRRVLIAEDAADAADALGALVDLLGHETRIAADGPAAVEAAKAFRPHLALVDLGLPGFDGYEVARRLRAEPEGGPAILAALTGWGQESDRRRAFEAGFDRHLTKPLAPGDLESLLGAVPAGIGESPPPSRNPAPLRPANLDRDLDPEELGRLAHGLRGSLNNISLTLRKAADRPPIRGLLERVLTAGQELAGALEEDAAKSTTVENGPETHPTRRAG